LWGRALSAQTSSRAHPAPTSTGIARRSPAAKVELWSSLALWCTRGSTTVPIRSGDIGMPVRGHGQDTTNAAGFDSQSRWDCPRCKHTQKKGDVSDFVHVKSPAGHLAILTWRPFSQQIPAGQGVPRTSSRWIAEIRSLRRMQAAAAAEGPGAAESKCPRGNRKVAR